jgi:hypothetical protein
MTPNADTGTPSGGCVECGKTIRTKDRKVSVAVNKVLVHRYHMDCYLARSVDTDPASYARTGRYDLPPIDGSGS